MAMRLDRVTGKANTPESSGGPKRGRESRSENRGEKRGEHVRAHRSHHIGDLSDSGKKADGVASQNNSATNTHPRRPQIRPWSQRGLAKAGRSRKERLGLEGHHMNEDLINFNDAPLFWVDLPEKSPLSALQDRLLVLERKALALARLPKTIGGRAFARLRIFKGRF